MPNLQQVFREAGYEDELYIIVQRIGSHSIHGTWTDLLTFYIEDVGGRFVAQDTPGPRPPINHLVLAAQLVLDALMSYAEYMIAEPQLISAVQERLQQVLDGLS